MLEAVRGVRDHQFEFWDAEIWAVARLNQIAIVLSADFDIGRRSFLGFSLLSIPFNASVTSATFYAYLYDAWDSSCVLISLRRVTS